MSAQLVTAFESLIPDEYKLPKSGACWVLTEPGAGNSRFEVAAGKSYAFTLDQDGVDVFPFLTGAFKGVKSVTDGLLITVIGQDLYVVAIELKTSQGQVSDALKQIESGRLFAKWARELLSFHKHWVGGACRFFAVISLKPRVQIRKGTSTRVAHLPSAKKSPHGPYPYFVLENHPRVSVADLVAKLRSFGPCPFAA